MYRRGPRGLEVLLVHPGGPYFANKDAGAWSIPKGLVGANEEPLDAARREFVEETSFAIDADVFVPLDDVSMKSGKRVLAWAFEGDCDPSAAKSNTFEIEWPPRSGRTRSFPEIDRADWFELSEARVRINAAQASFLDRLSQRVAS